MAANEEMTAAELSSYRAGYRVGQRFPPINAGEADSDEEASFDDLHGIATCGMTAEERFAYVRGFDRARLSDDDAGDDSEADEEVTE